jgi:hypothetical protein
MRKSVSLGLLALSVGFFADSAFAGNTEECEPLKQSGQKSLYGLCVAWHNADDEATKDALGQKFLDRAGYRVPGSEVPPQPTEPDFYCPCWANVSFADVCALGAAERVTVIPTMGITIVKFDGLVEATTETFANEASTPGCKHTIAVDATGELPLNNVQGGLTEEEALDCLAEVVEISTLYSNVGGDCTVL